VRGARAVRSVFLDEMGLGEGDLGLIVVWIDMLPADNRRAAELAASIFDPFPWVAQFHDPHRLAGKAIAASIGAPGQIAWDMYLFYKSDARWIEQPPEPDDWVHQLGDDPWAQADKFYWDEKLPPALRTRMLRLLAQDRNA
jgi:hypothetical protein